MSKKESRSMPPWYRAKFDLEGLGFGGLALVLAIVTSWIAFIGGIISLIFWIAFVAILFASRDAERTTPVGTILVTAPCDGVIVDVATVPPPRELRWDTPEVVRIRLSSSPFTVNGVRAPITGNIESILEEDGAPTALALEPDNSDLKEAFVLFSGEQAMAGIRVATGGLGPRLDFDIEAGDGVRGGRKIGVRRLGGWCDVFLPLGATVSLMPGMSVVGGETILTDLEGVDTDTAPASEAAYEATPTLVPEDVEVTPAVEPAVDEAPTVVEAPAEPAPDTETPKT